MSICHPGYTADCIDRSGWNFSLSASDNQICQKATAATCPLFEATSEVAKQNLDFEVGHSNIKEFEDVLISFSHMKESLKASLEQQ